jgi:hypothetical protein
MLCLPVIFHLVTHLVRGKHDNPFNSIRVTILFPFNSSFYNTDYFFSLLYYESYSPVEGRE